MTTKGAGGYMEGSSLPGHPAGYPPQPLDTPHQVTDNKSFLFFCMLNVFKIFYYRKKTH